jgi:DNA modification methylase
MKTLKEHLKVYDFIDEENEQPIVVESYHIDDVLKAVKEWLTQNQILFSDGNYAFDFEVMWAKWKSDVAQVRQWNKENPVNAFIMGYMLAQKELLEDLEK